MMPARMPSIEGKAGSEEAGVFDTWRHDACHVLYFLFTGAGGGSGILARRALASLMSHLSCSLFTRDT
jgi:hypothetical protein